MFVLPRDKVVHLTAEQCAWLRANAKDRPDILRAIEEGLDARPKRAEPTPETKEALLDLIRSVAKNPDDIGTGKPVEVDPSKVKRHLSSLDWGGDVDGDKE